MDTPRFEPQDPAFAERVRASFAKQAAMHTIGALLGDIAPGRVAIELPWQQGLTQQRAYGVHGGLLRETGAHALGEGGILRFEARCVHGGWN